MMNSAWRLTTHENGIADLVLDLPGEKVNKLSTAVMEELRELMGQLGGMAEQIDVLLVSSGKTGNFIAGADITEIRSITTSAEAEAKAELGQELLNHWVELPFLTVCLIDGAALGGGLEFALACDYRVVTDSPKTKLGFPEVNLGIIPGFGGTQRLPHLVGKIDALDLILSGKQISGKQAYRIGLADAHLPQAFADEKTREFCLGLLTPEGSAAAHTHRKKARRKSLLLECTPVGRIIIYKLTEVELRKKTGGHYPAPFAALRVIRKTHRMGMRAGLKVERHEFGRLAPKQISKNLVELFFTGEALKHHPIMQGEGAPGAIERAAVLGAGVMGGRIAWLFSNKQIPVALRDISWEAVQQGCRAAHSVYKEVAKRKSLSASEISNAMQLITGTTEAGALGWPDIVIEAVVEDLETKKKVLSETEQLVEPDTILATNTSSLSVAAMSAALSRPEQFVGLHFFNPPNRMPLIELVRGPDTSDDTLRTVALLARKLGKTPILVKDCPGFLVNRVLMPYLTESVALLEEGADLRHLDQVFKQYGMPMGPIRLLDEIGIDVGSKVAGILATAYGERMQISPFFEGVTQHRDMLGKKTKAGFYLYDKKKPRPNPAMQELLPHTETPAAKFDDEQLKLRPLLLMVNEAARCIEEEVVESPAFLDMALIMGTGFPAFRGGLLKWADTYGIEQVYTTLGAYAEKYGPRFAPTPLIEELARKESGFYGL